MSDHSKRILNEKPSQAFRAPYIQEEITIIILWILVIFNTLICSWVLYAWVMSHLSFRWRQTFWAKYRYGLDIVYIINSIGSGFFGFNFYPRSKAYDKDAMWLNSHRSP